MGRRLSGSQYIVEGGGDLSSLFFSSFLFVLFFLSAFNCHLYFLWESRNLLSRSRGTVYGGDKEAMNTFAPGESVLSPPLLPPPFNYSPPSFFFIHLSPHLNVHVTLLFLNHSHWRGERVVENLKYGGYPFLMHICKAELSPDSSGLFRTTPGGFTGAEHKDMKVFH